MQPCCLHLFGPDLSRLHYNYDWTYHEALVYVECHVVRARSLGNVIMILIVWSLFMHLSLAFRLFVTLMIFLLSSLFIDTYYLFFFFYIYLPARLL